MAVSPAHKKIAPTPDHDPPPLTEAGAEIQDLFSSSHALTKKTNQLIDWQVQESQETAHSLKEKQKLMEEQVYRIWTVLSTFEESSAACISEMLRHVSSGHYLEGVRMAGKFVLHVETLFAAIDDLDALFRSKSPKGMFFFCALPR